MKYDILFFDLDGTITDSLAGVANALDRVFSHYGLSVDRAIYRGFVGPPLRTSFPPHFGTGDKLEEALSIFREYYVDKGIYEADLFSGIESTLIELKARGYRLFVATSKREDVAINVLKHFGVDHLFERIFGANEKVGIIEKEDVLEHAMLEYKFDKSRCLMIGDTMYDVRGAEHIGIDCLAVLYGFGDCDELLASDVIGSVDNAIDLLNIL